MTNKSKSLTIILNVFALVFFMACAGVNAEDTGGISNVYIDYPPTPWLFVPDTLSLPQTFSSPTADVTAYKAFNPSVPTNRIKVIDYTGDTHNTDNRGFQVQLQISDFISVQNAQNKIPFTNIGLVTLAEAQSSQTVNTASFNIPAGDDSGSVLSPTKNCIWDPNWDINPASFGLSSCNDFYNVEFDTDGHSMKPITIMDAPLTRATGRMGQYWLSLGLKLLIPRATPSGTYSSTFTFTLIYPNP